MEQWKSIRNYEGLYEVSSLGRIRSISRKKKVNIKNNEFVVHKGRVLKQSLKRNGYYSFDASKDGKAKTITVHRMIAEAFIPNPDNKPCINHKNAIKTDNRIENLEWVTYKENSEHASDMDLFPTPQKVRIQCIELQKEFESSVVAARWLNDTVFKGSKNIKTISKNIRRACTDARASNKAYNYRWKNLIE